MTAITCSRGSYVVPTTISHWKFKYPLSPCLFGANVNASLSSCAKARANILAILARNCHCKPFLTVHKYWVARRPNFYIVRQDCSSVGLLQGRYGARLSAKNAVSNCNLANQRRSTASRNNSVSANSFFLPNSSSSLHPAPSLHCPLRGSSYSPTSSSSSSFAAAARRVCVCVRWDRHQCCSTMTAVAVWDCPTAIRAHPWQRHSNTSFAVRHMAIGQALNHPPKHFISFYIFVQLLGEYSAVTARTQELSMRQERNFLSCLPSNMFS